MLRVVLLSLLVLNTKAASASATASLSERQTLLGLSDASYYVISTEVETKISHSDSFQRLQLKQYHLNTNQLISASVLSEVHLSADTERAKLSAAKQYAGATNLDDVLADGVVLFTGYAKRPTKSFNFDKQGLYLVNENKRDYVMSFEEVQERIPNYSELLQSEFTRPTVEAIHSEQNITGIRYFLVVRVSDWRSDLSSFEYVISLPQN